MHLKYGRAKINPARRLRELTENGPFPLRGAWGGTAHHAQLTEAAGFQFFGLSGHMISIHALGLPDAGLLTATELVTAVRQVCEATNLPVFVDCDTGFGSALNVRRTVSQVILAGAAGLFIEDQTSPKRCGLVAGITVISTEEAAGKIRAACDARDEIEPDVIIMARTDARNAENGGFASVMDRCGAFLEAGADVLYVSALQSREEISEIRRNFPTARLEVHAPGIRPKMTDDDFEMFGLYSTGVHLAKVGTIAMFNFLRDYLARGEQAFHEFEAATSGHPLAGHGMFDLTGFPRLVEWEETYLPRDQARDYGASSAEYNPKTAAGTPKCSI